MRSNVEGVLPVRLIADPVFGEVDLTASAEELADLAKAVAEGSRFIGSKPPLDDNALAGIEARSTFDPGMRIELDASRQVLLISGDHGARGSSQTTWRPWPPARTAVISTSTTSRSTPTSSADLYRSCSKPPGVACRPGVGAKHPRGLI